MGAGKTVVGRSLARRMNVPFVDLDEVIEAMEGTSISEIFDQHGEPVFRDLERKALATALDEPAGVIAAGGGLVEDPLNRKRLADETVVFLDVSLDDALARIDDDERRPMLALVDPGELLARRRPMYEGVADISVDTTSRPVEDVVDEIASRIPAGRGR